MSKSSCVNPLCALAVAALEELAGFSFKGDERCCVMYGHAERAECIGRVNLELAYCNLTLVLDFRSEFGD